jgi:hypothetical protein
MEALKMSGTKISNWRSESILDIYNLSFAAFLFISPWLFAYAQQNARIDILVSSAAVAATAISAILAYANWKEWLNVLLGAWLIVSPWMLGFAHTRAMHFCIGIGIAVAFMAIVELLVVNYPPTVNPPSA